MRKANKTKKFKKVKNDIAETKKARVKKMGGGMMGRRFGMSKSGTPFKKQTNKR